MRPLLSTLDAFWRSLLSLGLLLAPLLPGLQPLGSVLGERWLSQELVFGVRVAPFRSLCILVHCTTRLFLLAIWSPLAQIPESPQHGSIALTLIVSIANF